MRAALESFDRVLDGRVGGDQDDKHLGIELQQAVHYFNTVDAWQLHVAKNDVEPVGVGRAHRIFTARAGSDRVPLLSQVFGEGIANQRLIVNDEQVGR